MISPGVEAAPRLNLYVTICFHLSSRCLATKSMRSVANSCHCQTRNHSKNMKKELSSSSRRSGGGDAWKCFSHLFFHPVTMNKSH